MTITIALVPMIGLLVLFIISLVFGSLRSTKIARLKSESEAFLAQVIMDDSRLQERFVSDLLEGKPLGDTIDTFERSRAALLPASKIGEPAAWDADTLRQFTQQRFENKATEVTRKCGTAALLSSVFVIAACLVTVSVLYQFAPGTSDVPIFTQPAVDPFSTSFPTPLANPPPDAPDVPSATPPMPLQAEGADGTSESDGKNQPMVKPADGNRVA